MRYVHPLVLVPATVLVRARIPAPVLRIQPLVAVVACTAKAPHVVLSVVAGGISNHVEARFVDVVLPVVGLEPEGNRARLVLVDVQLGWPCVGHYVVVVHELDRFAELAVDEFGRVSAHTGEGAPVAADIGERFGSGAFLEAEPGD